jgi:hypothetical protein
MDRPPIVKKLAIPLSPTQSARNSPEMPVGELIAEVILEIVLYGVAYFTGYVVLKAVALGTLRLAPLSTFEERNRGKTGRRGDWSIWLHKTGSGRMLKAECVMAVGILTWAAAAIMIYFIVRT